MEWPPKTRPGGSDRTHPCFAAYRPMMGRMSVDARLKAAKQQDVASISPPATFTRDEPNLKAIFLAIQSAGVPQRST
eukprot:scaffold3581_cov252-Pinguiococcus_pyrenoidosus.AAC.14